jgi:response regulator NasT
VIKLRVMLVDEDAERAALVEQALLGAGYEVVAKLAGQHDLLRSVRDVQPDVVIVDLESPDRDTLESMRHITREQPKPIVMFAEKGDSDTIADAIRAGVSAYVVDGLSGNRVKPILDVAIARFREFQALRDELEQTKTTLAERKIIEKAKGLIMKKRGCDEEQAYKALRKLAMDRNQRLADVAREVVSVADLLG